MLIQQSNKHQLKDDVDEVFYSDFDFSYAVYDIHSVGTMVMAPILRLSTSCVHRQLEFTLSIYYNPTPCILMLIQC